MQISQFPMLQRVGWRNVNPVNPMLVAFRYGWDKSELGFWRWILRVNVRTATPEQVEHAWRVIRRVYRVYLSPQASSHSEKRSM